MAVELQETHLENLLDPVVDIAERAGDVVLDHYDDVDPEVTYKEDESPLTAADEAADELIGDELRDLHLQLPVLSEESDDAAFEERHDWRTFWLVDPLDGTKEFLKRNGEFTVNIGLVQEGEPVLGVVHAPDLGTSWYASQGNGAHRVEGDERRAIEAPDSPDSGEPLQILASRSHLDETTEAFVEYMGEEREVELIRKGSSLKICLVADGTAHLYPRLAPTYEWDTAAAHCVAREAGGGIVRRDGEQLTYNKEEISNPHFIAFAERELVPFDFFD